MKKVLMFTLLLFTAFGLTCCSSDDDDNTLDGSVMSETLLTSITWSDGTYEYEFYKNHSFYVTRVSSNRVTSGSLTYDADAVIGSWIYQNNTLTLTVYGRTSSSMDIPLSLVYQGYNNGHHVFKSGDETITFTDGTLKTDQGDASSHDKAVVGKWISDLVMTDNNGSEYNVTMTMTLNSDGSANIEETGDLTNSRTTTWSTSKGLITINGIFDTSFYRIGYNTKQLLLYSDNGYLNLRFNQAD